MRPWGSCCHISHFIKPCESHFVWSCYGYSLDPAGPRGKERALNVYVNAVTVWNIKQLTVSSDLRIESLLTSNLAVRSQRQRAHPRSVPHVCTGRLSLSVILIIPSDAHNTCRKKFGIDFFFFFYGHGLSVFASNHPPAGNVKRSAFVFYSQRLTAVLRNLNVTQQHRGNPTGDMLCLSDIISSCLCTAANLLKRVVEPNPKCLSVF